MSEEKVKLTIRETLTQAVDSQLQELNDALETVETPEEKGKIQAKIRQFKDTKLVKVAVITAAAARIENAIQLIGGSLLAEYKERYELENPAPMVAFKAGNKERWEHAIGVTVLHADIKDYLQAGRDSEVAFQNARDSGDSEETLKAALNYKALKVKIDSSYKTLRYAAELQRVRLTKSKISELKKLVDEADFRNLLSELADKVPYLAEMLAYHKPKKSAENPDPVLTIGPWLQAVRELEQSSVHTELKALFTKKKGGKSIWEEVQDATKGVKVAKTPGANWGVNLEFWNEDFRKENPALPDNDKWICRTHLSVGIQAALRNSAMEPDDLGINRDYRPLEILSVEDQQKAKEFLIGKLGEVNGDLPKMIDLGIEEGWIESMPVPPEQRKGVWLAEIFSDYVLKDPKTGKKPANVGYAKTIFEEMGLAVDPPKKGKDNPFPNGGTRPGAWQRAIITNCPDDNTANAEMKFILVPTSATTFVLYVIDGLQKVTVNTLTLNGEMLIKPSGHADWDSLEDDKGGQPIKDGRALLCLPEEDSPFNKVKPEHPIVLGDQIFENGKTVKEVFEDRKIGCTIYIQPFAIDDMSYVGPLFARLFQASNLKHFSMPIESAAIYTLASFGSGVMRDRVDEMFAIPEVRRMIIDRTSDRTKWGNHLVGHTGKRHETDGTLIHHIGPVVIGEFADMLSLVMHTLTDGRVKAPVGTDVIYTNLKNLGSCAYLSEDALDDLMTAFEKAFRFLAAVPNAGKAVDTSGNLLENYSEAALKDLIVWLTSIQLSVIESSSYKGGKLESWADLSFEENLSLDGISPEEFNEFLVDAAFKRPDNLGDFVVGNDYFQPESWAIGFKKLAGKGKENEAEAALAEGREPRVGYPLVYSNYIGGSEGGKSGGSRNVQSYITERNAFGAALVGSFLSNRPMSELVQEYLPPEEKHNPANKKEAAETF